MLGSVRVVGLYHVSSLLCHQGFLRLGYFIIFIGYLHEKDCSEASSSGLLRSFWTMCLSLDIHDWLKTSIVVNKVLHTFGHILPPRKSFCIPTVR